MLGGEGESDEKKTLSKERNLKGGWAGGGGGVHEG